MLVKTSIFHLQGRIFRMDCMTVAITVSSNLIVVNFKVSVGSTRLRAHFKESFGEVR